MLLNNRWIRASGELHDKPITIQYRDGWELMKESEKYPVCVQIAWNAESADDSNGFPGQGEQQRIMAFHDQLQSQLEQDEKAVVCMMITHSGVNQWVVYSQSVEHAEDGLNQIPTEDGLFPIEVVADEDPDWQTFTQVYQAIRQS